MELQISSLLIDLQERDIEISRLQTALRTLEIQYEEKVAEIQRDHEEQIIEYNKRVLDSERYLAQLEQAEKVLNAMEDRVAAKESKIQDLGSTVEALKAELQRRKDSDINDDTEEQVHITLAAVDREFNESGVMAMVTTEDESVECRPETDDASVQTTQEFRIPVVNEMASTHAGSEAVHSLDEDVVADVQQILALNQELEVSVEVLKAEIWAANERMKKVVS